MQSPDQTPMRFTDSTAVREWLKTNNLQGFAHPNFVSGVGAHWLACDLNDAGVWAYTSEDNLVFLPEW